MTCPKAKRPTKRSKATPALSWAVCFLIIAFVATPSLASEKAAPKHEAKHEEKKEPAEKKAEKKEEAGKKEEPKEKKEAPKKEVARHGEKEGARAPEEPRPPTPQSVLNEVAGYTRLARQAADQEKWTLVEYFLEKMVDQPATDDEKKSALQEIAKAYELHEIYPKAVAMYERINTLFSSDPDQAQRLLDLGQLYRKIGSNELAIARFYNVLNASLTLNNRKLESSKMLALRAQTEIADTQFDNGNYPQARRYYELLTRLELPPEERARVNFRLAHTLYLLGEIILSGAATQQFLEDFPDDPAAPQCRYLLACSLRGLNRPKEAYEQVLALVKEQDANKTKDHEKWLFWQKKAGNEFANDLYQKGEFMEALTIYQNLATLDTNPEWQWPVVYQMALCFEKLRVDRKAAEAYKLIVDEAKKPGREANKLPDNVRNLIQMAQWRGEQLVWKNDVESRMDRILGQGTEAQRVANKTALFR
jgi:tetratricopeptide (TPR) repeat protein